MEQKNKRILTVLIASLIIAAFVWTDYIFLSKSKLYFLRFITIFLFLIFPIIIFVKSQFKDVLLPIFKNMDNKNRVIDYEYEKIKNEIPELSVYRKRYFSMLTLEKTIVIIPIVFFILGVVRIIKTDYFLVIFLVLVMVNPILQRKFKESARVNEQMYINTYKERFIKKLLMEKGLNYSDKGMPESEYTKFNYKKYDKYSSDDLVTGQINNVHFELANFQTYNKIAIGSYSDYGEISSGIIAKTFLNRDTSLLIDVVPRSNLKKDNAISIGNYEFENVFEISSSNESQVAKIFTPTVTKTILDLREKIDANFEIKIINMNIYFRFYISKLFEPCISNSKEEAQKIFTYFHMLEGIQKITESISKEMEVFIDG